MKEILEIGLANAAGATVLALVAAVVARFRRPADGGSWVLVACPSETGHSALGFVADRGASGTP